MRSGPITILLALAACTSPRTTVGDEGVAWSGNVEASLQVQVVFLKFRGNQIHLSVLFKNRYSEQVKVIGQGVQLEYGGVKGVASRPTTPDYLLAPDHQSRKILFKYSFAAAPQPGQITRIRVPVTRDDGTALGVADFSFAVN